jgi:hypothetical protein
VESQLREVSRRLDEWAGHAREQDRDRFIAGIESEIAQGAAQEIRGAYAQAAAPDQMYAGLERFWRKRAEATSSSR